MSNKQPEPDSRIQATFINEQQLSENFHSDDDSGNSPSTSNICYLCQSYSGHYGVHHGYHNPNDGDNETENLIAELSSMSMIRAKYCLSCPCNAFRDDLLSMMSFEANAQLHQRFFANNNKFNQPFSDVNKQSENYVPMNCQRFNLRDLKSKTLATNKMDAIDNEEENFSRLLHHPHCLECPLKSSCGNDQNIWLDQISWMNPNPPFLECSQATLQLMQAHFPHCYYPLMHRIEEAIIRTHALYNDLGCAMPSSVGYRLQRLHQYVELNIFLPHGFFVQLTANNDCTLAEIKRDLWLKFDSMITDIKRRFEHLRTHRSKLHKSIKWFCKNPFSSEAFLRAGRKLSFSKTPINYSSFQETITAANEQVQKQENLKNKMSDPKDESPSSTHGDRPSHQQPLNDDPVAYKQFSYFSDGYQKHMQKQDGNYNKEFGSSRINLLNNDGSNGNIIDTSIFLEDQKLNLKFLSFAYDDQCDFSFQSLANPWEEIYDDNCHLYELNEQIPYYLRLVELTNDKNEKILNARIRKIINRPVNELESYRTDEFRDYRYGMYQCMLQTVKHRESLPIEDRLFYEFEPELDEIETLNLSVHTLNKFKPDDLSLTMANANEDDDEQSVPKFIREDNRYCLESLAKEFDMPLPYKQKIRQRNFSSVNSGLSKNISKEAYLPYNHRDLKSLLSSGDISNREKNPLNEERPFYTEVFVVPTTEAQPQFTHEQSSSIFLEQINPLLRHQASSKILSKHKRHLKHFKHQPSLQPVPEEDESRINEESIEIFDQKESYPIGKGDLLNETDTISTDTIALDSKIEDSHKTYSKKFQINIWASYELILNKKINQQTQSSTKSLLKNSQDIKNLDTEIDNLITKLSNIKIFDNEVENTIIGSVGYSKIDLVDSNPEEKVEQPQKNISATLKNEKTNGHNNNDNNMKLMAMETPDQIKSELSRLSAMTLNQEEKANKKGQSVFHRIVRSISLGRKSNFSRNFEQPHDSSRLSLSAALNLETVSVSHKNSIPKLMSHRSDAKDTFSSSPSSSSTEEKFSQGFQLITYSFKTPKELIQKLLIQMILNTNLYQNLFSPSSSGKIEHKLKNLLSEHLTINPVSKTKTSTSHQSNQSVKIPFEKFLDCCDLDADSYLLKICGYNQYLLRNHALIRFEYIRNCISKGKIPHLQMVRKESIINCVPSYVHLEPSFLRRLQHRYRSSSAPSSTTSWNDYESNNSDISYKLVDGYNSKGRYHSNKRNYRICSSPSQSLITKIPTNVSTGYSSLRDQEEYCHYSTISHVIQQKDNESKISISSQTLNKETINTNLKDETEPEIDDSNGFYEEFIDNAETLDSWIYRGIYEHKKLISLWKIRSIFRMRVLLASYVNVKDVGSVFVQAGIFHGTEPLGQIRCTKQVGIHNLRWNQMLEFHDILIHNLPLSARLSLTLCVTDLRRNQDFYPIGWVNLPLFNYRRCLLSGRISLILWQMLKSSDMINDHESSSLILNPSGCIGSNPMHYPMPRLDLEFDSFSNPVVYPPYLDVLKHAKLVNRQESSMQQYFQQRIFGPRYSTLLYNSSSSNNRIFRTDSIELMLKQFLKSLSKRDPLVEMSEQEKDFFWRERFIIKNLCPDALPKVIDSVRWTNREEVCQLYALLDRWPVVSVDVAIALLGHRYPDLIVRSFAIRCMDQGLTNGLMLHFLLQLIQLLPNEMYLNNDLAQLLLRRALLNRRFGNLFFWHLRSRLSEPYYGPRWCVLLEMYCRGLSEQSLLDILFQVMAFEEVERISVETISVTDRHQAIKKKFNQEKVLKVVNEINNPLNITLRLGQLQRDNLRVMDSAKRPLWLEWLNADPYSKLNGLQISAIIFKSGDDLRQDMLTLQVIRIMDVIWRRENLDLRMLPYNCLATGNQVGLIEVVPYAKTVMGIQRVGGRKAALQIDSSKLHKWIRKHNIDNYDNAVDNFTRSCAGYCVATFILGIGDRNPDNIMVNEDGQIFHIDFGHFLGHFKKKFGINRERVPFVLTYDFLRVISKGAENPLKSKEFEAFQNLCNAAYLALHDNANLLISLFTMMLGIGIPELQTLDDIQYLRQTLQVDRTRQQALQYFEQQLDEAHGGAWSTKLDWFFHSVKHA